MQDYDNYHNINIINIMLKAQNKLSYLHFETEKTSAILLYKLLNLQRFYNKLNHNFK